MKKLLASPFLRAAALIACISALSGLSEGANHYVIANDDTGFPFSSGVTFYAVGADGVLTLKQRILTGGSGISGGYFGAKRVAVLDSGNQQCAYLSDAASGVIEGIAIGTLTAVGTVSGSLTDGGTSNGIGLAANDQYLYASFTDSNTIGTFAVQAGCHLSFLNDTPVAGLNAGVINGMAIHGNLMVTTYTDGSIESFDISDGTPVSNGDEQLSTATVRSEDASYPNSIEITRDGRFAIFGDTSTALVVEVSYIVSGKLSKTVVYKSAASISSSNVMLSPDESMLYVANTQGDAVSALYFNKATGKLSAGCTSGPLKGQSAKWSYLASMALMGQTGNGGGVYVAEFGGPSSIATVRLDSAGQTCSLREDPTSPVADPNSTGLLSIGSFPPRAF
jgi:sugar lactone lactonase YvrE